MLFRSSGEWTAEVETCSRCASLHLIRRLGQVECLDCGLVREPDAMLNPSLVAAARPVAGRPDSALAEEVGRALDRLLGGSRRLSRSCPGSANG